LKIIFIVPEIGRTGGMRVIFECANRLQARGHNVTLISPIFPFNSYKGKWSFSFFKYRMLFAIRHYLRGSGIPGNMFKHNFNIKYVFNISDSLTDNADAVIATSFTSAYAVDRLKIEKKKKYYLIQDNEIWNCNVERAKKSYNLDLNRIVVSEYLKNFLKIEYNAKSEKILIAVNYDNFYNDDKKWTLPFKILFSDHPLKNKNTEQAIRIVIKLKEKYPDLIIRAFGLSNFHQMPGFVEFHKNPDDEEIRKLYCDSDIYLYTSIYEGFGLPPAEAMACKCAVVGNNVAAIPEYAINKKTAIITNPENPDELFKGVEYLLKNPDELKRISLNGYEHIRKILDWEKAVSILEKLIINS
jgi:glycosyltransferase involved in cell wall biosynthesis